MKLTAMIREEPPFPGGPTTASVHPDNVPDMQACGWRIAGAESSVTFDDLIQAINALEDEPDAWTAAGLPSTDRLSELMGRKITASERDGAWDEYKGLGAGGTDS